MLGALRQLFIPKPPQAVDTTYIALVAAARNPFFYTTLNVPDTLDGRFGLIVVHLFLLEYRLIEEGAMSTSRRMEASPAQVLELAARSRDGRGEPERSERGGAVAGARRPLRASAEKSFAQFLSEAFFNDMDCSLRELGVADTGVSHRIKKMGKAYHGCLQAYAAGMHDPQLLRAALARNLYGTVESGDVSTLARMADYIGKMHAQLAAVDTATILSGNYTWPDAATLGV